MEQRIIKRGIILLAVVSLTVLSFSGCYYDNEQTLYKNYYQNNTCDTTTVSFAQDVMPIIQGNCATSGCHVSGGTGNGIFTNYAGVKDKVDNGSFKNRVLVLKNMPLGASLTDCQYKILTAWLNRGAPNN